MELFQSCPSALPWPKVFSPKVIIRDGQGCHESLVPHTVVVPGQYEKYHQPGSPVLLDLSRSAKHDYAHGQSVVNPSQEECDACLPNHRCDANCPQNNQNCKQSGTICPSLHSMQLHTETFSRPEIDHQTDRCCGQYFHKRPVPYTRDGTAVESSNRTTSRSSESDRRVFCSGTLSPPDPKSYRASSKDLRMSAVSCCSPLHQLMTTDPTSSDTKFNVQDTICNHSTKSAVPEPHKHHQHNFPHEKIQAYGESQFCCSNEMFRLGSWDCPNSEKPQQEIRRAPTLQDFINLESIVADSDSGSCPTQCLRVSRDNDEERGFIGEKRHHADNFIAHDMSCAGKSPSCCHNIACKPEIHSSICSKLNKDLDCSNRGTLSGQNLSPVPSLRREMNNNYPSVVCAESHQAETRSHSLVYHGIWTLTKTTSADTESIFDLATIEGHLGAGFLPNNMDTNTNTSPHREAYAEQCQCRNHGPSSDQSTPDLHTFHTPLQWRNKSYHAQTPDRISSKYSPYWSAQEVYDDDVPYDLSMKSVNNNKEHGEINDSVDTSLLAAQSKTWCSQQPQSAYTRMCHSGTRESKETCIHSAEMTPLTTPEDTKLLHLSSDKDHESTAGWCLRKEKPEPSTIDNSEAINSPQRHGYSHEHRTPGSTPHHVWPRGSGQSEPELETLNTVSSVQLATLLCSWESLTDTQTQEQHPGHVPGPASPLTTELGHLYKENVLLTSSLSQSKDQATAPPSAEDIHQQTVSASAEMPQPVSTQGPSSGDKTDGDSCSSTSAALSPLTPTDLFQTQIHPESTAETPAAHAKMSTVIAKMSPVCATMSPVRATMSPVRATMSPVRAEMPTVNAKISTVNAKMSTVNTKVPTVHAKGLTEHAKVSTATSTPPSHLQESSTRKDASNQHAQCSSRKRRPRLRNFKCDLCSVTCSNRGQLKGHLRTHTGERPFVCQEPGCNKTFVRNEELTRHRRIHSGERPYACSHCGKTFMRKDHLNKHQRMHGD